MKRIWSIILTLCLLAGMAPPFTKAAETPTPADTAALSSETDVVHGETISEHTTNGTNTVDVGGRTGDASEQLSPPTFSEPRMNSENALELDIQAASDDITVYYYITTEDDPATDDPRERGMVYAGIPILISPDMQIVAVATKFGYPDSEVAKWKYTDALNDLVSRGDA